MQSLWGRRLLQQEQCRGHGRQPSPLEAPGEAVELHGGSLEVDVRSSGPGQGIMASRGEESIWNQPSSGGWNPLSHVIAAVLG